MRWSSPCTCRCSRSSTSSVDRDLRAEIAGKIRDPSVDQRLQSELRRFGDRHPGVALAWRTALEHRFVVLLCLAVARAMFDGLAYQHPDDPAIFAEAARRLVSGGWTETFADARVQIGPLGVLFHYPVAVATDIFDRSPTFALSFISGVSFTVSSLAVFRWLMRGLGRENPGLEMFVGLALLAGGPSWVASTSGHPEEGFIALLWLLAAGHALRGRSEMSGAFIGVAVGLKLSGILGLPILLLDKDLRRSCRGLVVAGATAAVVYVPFLLWGTVEMFSFEWHVRPQSPLAFLGLAGEPFTWSMRVVQTTIILIVGMALALRHRSSSRAVWFVPLGISAARLLTDPLDYHYYWLGPGLVLLMGLTSVLPDRPSIHRITVAALFYVGVVPFFFLSGHWLGAYLVMLGGSLLMIVVPKQPQPETIG